MKSEREYIAESLVFPTDMFYKNSFEFQCPHCLGINVHNTDDVLWCYDCCASSSLNFTLSLLER